MNSNFRELTKSEMIEINGGEGVIYDIGYAVGYAIGGFLGMCARCLEGLASV